MLFNMLYDKLMTKVTGRDIQNFRARHDLKQQELASILSIGVATLSRWECGKKKPSSTAGAVLSALIAHEMGVPESELYGLPGYHLYTICRKIFSQQSLALISK